MGNNRNLNNAYFEDFQGPKTERRCMHMKDLHYKVFIDLFALDYCVIVPAEIFEICFIQFKKNRF